MRPRRPVLVLVALGLLAVAGPTGWAGSASAGCVAPTLRVVGSPWERDRAERVRVDAGAGLVVEGRDLRDSCNDTGTTSTSPLGCEKNVVDPVGPAADVTLRLEQDGRTWVLGRADADASFDATWRVRLPNDVQPGAARLVAGGSEPLRLLVVAGR